MTGTRVLVVGGSDAGISAALRARELDPAAQVAVLVADAYPNFSICGLPYLLGGDVPDWRRLAHRSREELEATGMEVLVDRTARTIDPDRKRVLATDAHGRETSHAYDRLVVATGATPVVPPIDGIEHPGVHVLHTMGDAFAVQDAIERASGGAALIVGAGYIGLEMVEALASRGLAVTLVEQLDEVLPTVDQELGAVLRARIARAGVEVVTGTRVREITTAGSRLVVRGSPALERTVDLALVVVGVQPDAALAASAGAQLGVRGAIRVDRQMRTNLPDVFAAGDCASTYHRLLGQPAYLPLGTTAHKQGRVAGENAVGGSRRFEGSLGTQVVKVFDLAVARTGLRDGEAATAGYEPLTVGERLLDHKAYYPGASVLDVRMTGDLVTGRLLGVQIVGRGDAQVAKRIDVPAVAIAGGSTIEALSDLDLSYTPPFGSPWDPIQTIAQHWSARAHDPDRPRAFAATTGSTGGTAR